MREKEGVIWFILACKGTASIAISNVLRGNEANAKSECYFSDLGVISSQFLETFGFYEEVASDS